MMNSAKNLLVGPPWTPEKTRVCCRTRALSAATRHHNAFLHDTLVKTDSSFWLLELYYYSISGLAWKLLAKSLPKASFPLCPSSSLFFLLSFRASYHSVSLYPSTRENRFIVRSFFFCNCNFCKSMIKYVYRPSTFEPRISPWVPSQGSSGTNRAVNPSSRSPSNKSISRAR